MIGLPLGLFYSNAVEWVVHRYLLHGLGKRKDSIFAFHWSKHHKNSRRNGMYDPDYEKPLWDMRSRGKEVGGIVAIVALHLPLASIAPWFTVTVCYAGFNYLYRHEKSHLDIEWGKKHMRSHYDHHMGKNQDMNWCVTRPWFDWIMGTREHYIEPEQSLVWAVEPKADGVPAVSAAVPTVSGATLGAMGGELASLEAPPPSERAANENEPRRPSVPPAA